MLRPLPPGMGMQRMSVQVHRTAGGAIARVQRAQQAYVAPISRTEADLVDVLVRGVWSVAIDAGLASGWHAEEWRRQDFDPTLLLDTLARMESEMAFPYPSSPRLDGYGGGGGRIAEDGSPGVPPAWVRYIMRGEARSGTRYDADNVPDGGDRPGEIVSVGDARRAITLALVWLQQQQPELWALYRAHVLGKRTLAQVAAEASTTKKRLSVGQVRRRLGQARGLLLARLAYFSGEATAEEYAELIQRLTPPPPSPSPSELKSLERAGGEALGEGPLQVEGR